MNFGMLSLLFAQILLGMYQYDNPIRHSYTVVSNIKLNIKTIKAYHAHFPINIMLDIHVSSALLINNMLDIKCTTYRCHALYYI